MFPFKFWIHVSIERLIKKKNKTLFNMIKKVMKNFKSLFCNIAGYQSVCDLCPNS